MSRFTSEFSHAAGRLACLLACLLGACELNSIEVPTTASQVVVHGVLNPSATSQIILLERTLTGEVDIADTPFDAADPILSAGGIPIIGATVEIIDSAGKLVRGVEDRTVNPTGKGSGVYRVPMSGPSLMVGARYQLHVHTLEGEDLSAFTRIPSAADRSTGGLTHTINRDHDEVATQWKPVPGARSYAIRIESPFGPFFLFTDSTAIRLHGDLRNLFAGSLQRVFIPGFRQDIVLTAVDSNFYDYYRTNNDPFTGAGIISRIDGGLGLFGSVVNLNTGLLTVTADQTEPIEGRFLLTPATINQDTPTAIDLFVESPSARSDLPAALSGRYTLGSFSTRGDGIIGKLQGNNVSLALLANQLSGDTVEVFTGVLNGDTLRGNYTRRPRPDGVVFVRAR